MKQKLEEFKYADKESFAKDMQLIFDNGKKYYKKKSKNWKYAQELEEFAKPLLENLEPPSQAELDNYKDILGQTEAKPEPEKKKKTSTRKSRAQQ